MLFISYQTSNSALFHQSILIMCGFLIENSFWAELKYNPLETFQCGWRLCNLSTHNSIIELWSLMAAHYLYYIAKKVFEFIMQNNMYPWNTF